MSLKVLRLFHTIHTPPASLSVDHALDDLLVRQATIVVGCHRTHSRDGGLVGVFLLERSFACMLSNAVDLGRVGESADVGVGVGFWCWGSW
jgi:hypothetical protein